MSMIDIVTAIGRARVVLKVSDDQATTKTPLWIATRDKIAAELDAIDAAIVADQPAPELPVVEGAGSEGVLGPTPPARTSRDD